MTITLLGGIGLFLLGMTLLTDGIRACAGAKLREILARVVRGPVSAMFSGAALTVAVQSSSATTLTTIGFVNAGLLSFPLAIGVIFGANVGTTSIGWIVSVFGLKLSLSAVALPVVFVGAMLRLLGHGRLVPLGAAIAGFGLLFFGIGLLQDGMSGLAGRVDPATLPGGGFWGSLKLVGIGFVMVVVMQSSGATVAVTLAALHEGAIDIEQGAALIIGQNIGTTLTAVIAAIGASVAAKRTAAAHVVFNVLTGAMVFALLPVFFWAVKRWEAAMGQPAGANALAAFHTGFSVLGVLVFLPATGWFARLIEWMIPQRGSVYGRFLDASLTRLGSVGIDAAVRALTEVLGALARHCEELVRSGRSNRELAAAFMEARAALPGIAEFVAEVGGEREAAPMKSPESSRRIDLLHAIDHLESLGETIDRLDDRPGLVRRREVAAVRSGVERLLGVMGTDTAGLPSKAGEIAALAVEVAGVRKAVRSGILQDTAHGRISAADSGDLIDVTRWLDAVGYHTARALAYLAGPPRDDAEVVQPDALDPSSVHRS